MFKIYTRWDTPGHPGYKSDKPTKAQNHFKSECDINNIVKRGLVHDPLNPGTSPPMFDDFYHVSDYHTAQNVLSNANQMFAELPSDIRKYFDNNPAFLLEFLGKEENRDEAIRLGLISRSTDSSGSNVVGTTDNGDG